MDKSVSDLRSDVAMFQLDNRQIYKQLHQNKDCIQDYQTHHQHLEAKSANQKEVTLHFTEC